MERRGLVSFNFSLVKGLDSDLKLVTRIPLSIQLLAHILFPCCILSSAVLHTLTDHLSISPANPDRALIACTCWHQKKKKKQSKVPPFNRL